MMSSNMSAFAMEPKTEVSDVTEARLVETSTQDTQTGSPVELLESSKDTAVTPQSIYGYAAKYTNPLKGSFTVTSSGSGNSTGSFQITTHDFPSAPTINAVLYRPDGSYAGQIYIDGNGTKSIRFSNAVAGTYTIVYSVLGVDGGWISAWVSS